MLLPPHMCDIPRLPTNRHGSGGCATPTNIQERSVCVPGSVGAVPNTITFWQRTLRSQRENVQSDLGIDTTTSQNWPAGCPDKPSPCLFDTSTVYTSFDVSCFGVLWWTFVHSHPSWLESFTLSSSAKVRVLRRVSPLHSEPCLSHGPLPPNVYAPHDLIYFRVNEELDFSGFSDLMSTPGAQQGLCSPRLCPRVSVHPSPSLALPLWLNCAAESMLWAPWFRTRTCALPEALHTKEMNFSHSS